MKENNDLEDVRAEGDLGQNGPGDNPVGVDNPAKGGRSEDGNKSFDSERGVELSGEITRCGRMISPKGKATKKRVLRPKKDATSPIHPHLVTGIPSVSKYLSHNAHNDPDLFERVENCADTAWDRGETITPEDLLEKVGELEVSRREMEPEPQTEDEDSDEPSAPRDRCNSPTREGEPEEQVSSNSKEPGLDQNKICECREAPDCEEKPVTPPADFLLRCLASLERLKKLRHRNHINLEDLNARDEAYRNLQSFLARVLDAGLVAALVLPESPDLPGTSRSRSSAPDSARRSPELKGGA